MDVRVKQLKGLKTLFILCGYFFGFLSAYAGAGDSIPVIHVKEIQVVASRFDFFTEGQQKFTVSAMGRYEVMQDLTASLTASGERFSKKTVFDYPYRFNGVAGLSYALKNELTVGLTYTYVINLLDLDTTAGSKQINKAAIDLKKSF